MNPQDTPESAQAPSPAAVQPPPLTQAPPAFAQTPPPPAQVPLPVHAPPVEPALPETLDMKSLFEALLRRPHALIARLADPGHRATGLFGATALVSFLLFGLVLGCFAKHEQLWAAPVKITSGLLFAGVICFPSLFIFATLAGARVTLSQLAACLAGALALAGLLLLGFAPAIWIFAESTDLFGFMGLLSITAWLVALFFALRFIMALIFATGGTQNGPFFVWCLVFLLVSLQLTTTLRPILGRSDVFLAQEKKFFIQHWSDTMGASLGDKAPPSPAAVPTPKPDGVTPEHADHPKAKPAE